MYSSFSLPNLKQRKESQLEWAVKIHLILIKRIFSNAKMNIYYISCLRTNFVFCLQRANLQKKRTKVLILCGILLAFFVILSLPVSICTKPVKESDMRYRHLHLHLTFTFTFWVWWIFTHSNWSKHYHCIYIKLCAKLSIFITMFSWIRLLYVLCLKYRWNPFWVTRPIPSIMINWKLQ